MLKQIKINLAIISLALIAQALTSIILSSGVARADVSNLYNFRGRVTDASGLAVPDAAYDFSFAFFNTASGGAPLWSEDLTAGNCFSATISGKTVGANTVTYSFAGDLASSTLRLGQTLSTSTTGAGHEIVDFDANAKTITTVLGSDTFDIGDTISNRPRVENGLADINLGSVNSLSGLDFNAQLYLEVIFNGEVMQPRRIVTSAAQAFNAAKLGGFSALDFANIRANTEVMARWNFLNALGISTSTAETALKITQSGIGNIFELHSGSSSVMAVGSDGKVGIGTSTPSELLSVGNAAGSQLLVNSAGVITQGVWQGSTIDAAKGGMATDTSAWNGFAYVSNGIWQQMATDSLALTPASFATSTNLQWANDAGYIGLSELSSSATGLDYNSMNGQFSLAPGYAIPLSASTSAWEAKIGSQWTTNGSNISFAGGKVSIGTTTPTNAMLTLQNSGATPFISLNGPDGEYFSIDSSGYLSTRAHLGADGSLTLGPDRGFYFTNNGTDAYIFTNDNGPDKDLYITTGAAKSVVTDGSLSVGGAINATAGINIRSAAPLALGPGVSMLLWDDDTASYIVTNDDSDRDLFISTGANKKVILNGGLQIAGALIDGTMSTGTAGMIMTTTGTSTRWVTAASLGVGGSQWTTADSNIYYSDGFVGIGTSTPGSALAVVGDARIEGNLTATGLSADQICLGGVCRTSWPTSGAGSSGGTGTGMFETPVTYFATSGAESMASDDIDEDGNIDIVTANVQDNSVSIYYNDGTGVFAAPVSLGVGIEPGGVATGDFNGDGRIDIATINANDGNVSILVNNGGRSFAAHADYPANGGRGIAAGDLDKDNDLDLVLSNNNDNGDGTGSTTVLMNDGTGAFSQAGTYSVGVWNYWTAIGDVNADGWPDLVTTSGDGLIVTVYLNNQDGTFGSRDDYPIVSGAEVVNLADLNADGLLDMAITGPGSSVASVLMNNPVATGSFANRINYFGGDGHGLAVSDLNNDGWPDIVEADPATQNGSNQFGRIAVLLNNGNGEFPATAKYDVHAGDPHAITIDDFDGDGKKDVAAVNRANPYVLSVLLQASSSSGASSQWTTNGPDIYYNAGNIGIGTSAPQKSLDVDGQIRVTGNIGIGDQVLDYWNNSSILQIKTGGEGRVMDFFSTGIASRNFAEWFQNTSNFTGNGLLMDFAADNSGSFTGKYFSFLNNGIEQAYVSATGSAYFAGGIIEKTYEVDGNNTGFGVDAKQEFATKADLNAAEAAGSITGGGIYKVLADEDYAGAVTWYLRDRSNRDWRLSGTRDLSQPPYVFGTNGETTLILKNQPVIRMPSPSANSQDVTIKPNDNASDYYLLSDNVNLTSTFLAEGSSGLNGWELQMSYITKFSVFGGMWNPLFGPLLSFLDSSDGSWGNEMEMNSQGRYKRYSLNEAKYDSVLAGMGGQTRYTVDMDLYGAGAAYGAPVADEAELAAIPSPSIGEWRKTLDTGKSWVYTGQSQTYSNVNVAGWSNPRDSEFIKDWSLPRYIAGSHHENIVEIIHGSNLIVELGANLNDVSLYPIGSTITFMSDWSGDTLYLLTGGVQNEMNPHDMANDPVIPMPGVNGFRLPYNNSFTLRNIGSSDGTGANWVFDGFNPLTVTRNRYGSQDGWGNSTVLNLTQSAYQRFTLSEAQYQAITGETYASSSSYENAGYAGWVASSSASALILNNGFSALIGTSTSNGSGLQVEKDYGNGAAFSMNAGTQSGVPLQINFSDPNDVVNDRALSVKSNGYGVADFVHLAGGPADDGNIFSVIDSDQNGTGKVLYVEGNGLGNLQYLNASGLASQDMSLWQQSNSNFTGSGLKMDFANGSGAFTGKFISLNNGGIEQAFVTATGSAFFSSNLLIGSSTIGTSTDPISVSNGAFLSEGGVWTNASDVNLKENFVSLDSQDVLIKIKNLDIKQWNYKSENDTTRHIGPTAQDFYAAFMLGGSDKSISTIDPAGVAMLGVQALAGQVDDIVQRIGFDTATSSAKVEIISKATDSKKALLVMQESADSDIASFQTPTAEIMKVASNGEVKIVGTLSVDGRTLTCAGACPNALMAEIDATRGDIGAEGKMVASSFESYCEPGYVWVKGSAKYGTMPGFCAMQDLARQDPVNSNQLLAASHSSLTTEPWIDLDQSEAQAACLKSEAHLLNENEWLTIAGNIAQNAANDMDASKAGTQFNNQAGAFVLDNNRQIYDLAGKGQWIDMDLRFADLPEPKANERQEYSSIASFKVLGDIVPPYGLNDAQSSIGQILVGDNAEPVRGVIRGRQGIYDLDLSNNPQFRDGQTGFRCAK